MASQRGLLASAGVGLVTGMRSLLTSGWGRMPRFGNFHSEPLVDFVCVRVRKTNPLVGTLFLASVLQAWGSCWAMISPWAVPSHRFPGEWLCVEKELGPGARTCCEFCSQSLTLALCPEQDARPLWAIIIIASSSHCPSTFHRPDTTLTTFQELAHLILTTAPRGPVIISILQMRKPRPRAA